MFELNTLSKNDILAIIAEQTKQIERLENLLQGQPIAVVRIADASITSAKIQSLSADKITAGTLLVQVGVGTSANGGILLKGEDVQIIMFDEDDNRLLIGDNGV